VAQRYLDLSIASEAVVGPAAVGAIAYDKKAAEAEPKGLQ
jgi:hypothetical protein